MQALDTIDFIKKLQQEQPCDTCTNDKGCVTCKDGELWEGKEQPSEDLEEEIDSFWNKASGFSPKFTTLEVKRNGLGVIARHFANWQKEQMLKEVVEGEVYRYDGCQKTATAIIVDIPSEPLGDKVKIVIIPNKEEEK